MFKLHAKKLNYDRFEICLNKEGYPIEDYLYTNDSTVRELAVTGTALIKNEDYASTGSVTLSRSGSHGNAYHLAASINTNYVRVFILTEVELKLFIASLKRALDG